MQQQAIVLHLHTRRTLREGLRQVWEPDSLSPIRPVADAIEQQLVDEYRDGRPTRVSYVGTGG